MLDKKVNKEYKQMMFIYFCSVLCLSIFCTTMSGFNSLIELYQVFLLSTIFWGCMLAGMIPPRKKDIR